jgi:hypothetical protein
MRSRNTSKSIYLTHWPRNTTFSVRLCISPFHKRGCTFCEIRNSINHLNITLKLGKNVNTSSCTPSHSAPTHFQRIHWYRIHKTVTRSFCCKIGNRRNVISIFLIRGPIDSERKLQIQFCIELDDWFLQITEWSIRSYHIKYVAHRLDCQA